MVGKREGEPGAESRGFVPAGPIATLSSLKTPLRGPWPLAPTGELVGCLGDLPGVYK